MSDTKIEPSKVFECPPKCDHVWDETWRSEDGQMESAQCSKCGALAIDIDLLRLP